MAKKFLATADADTFTNPSHSLVLVRDIFGVYELRGGYSDPDEPYDGFVEGGVPSDHIDFINSFINSHGEGFYHFEVFADNSVDYSKSTALVSVDLTQATQQGGYAEGDSLGDIFEVTGSVFDDVIRGSNTSDYPSNTSRMIDGIENFFFTINNPGENVLNGGNGNDVLEGRGGADVLNGGFGFDYASYESSAARVTVRLAAINDTQTGLASGGDAAGDTLTSIEGLIGSEFDDRLPATSSTTCSWAELATTPSMVEMGRIPWIIRAISST